MESIDSIEIEIDPPDQIDLPPDLDMDTNNQNDLLLVPDEIDYPPDFDNEIASDNDSSNSDPTPNLDDYEMDVEPDNTNHQLPSYNITNFPMTNLENDDPALLLLDENDHYNEWEYESIDSGPANGPFLETCRTPIEDPDGNPEVFFNELFDERMWSTIAQSTNTYAQSKANTPTGNRCSDPTNPNYKKHCQLNTWTDITSSDVKIFFAHNIIMGLEKKSDLEKYWTTNSKTRIPFFGKYMSRNKFQSILWNLHISDDTGNPPHNQQGHDPLAKLRDFADMIDRNFLFTYKPSQSLSFDEACCPFKGRLRFRVYNPMKPNRFHIKLFQISGFQSGYILGYEVYTGKDISCISMQSNPLNPECGKTTKLVLGLLEKCKFLDKGHNIYMDNYYTSPELAEELYFRQTYCCGTVKMNRKDRPKTLGKANILPLQSAFLRKGPLLCLKWRGSKTKSKKKPVTILSTIHTAKEVLTKKKDSHGNRISKPQCVQEYTQNMSGVDISNQYMAFHVNLHKSMKWSRKLFFHLFNMLLLNAFILNKKYGKTKLSKDDFLEHIANYLLESGTEGATCLPKCSTLIPTQYSRLTERHFIQNYTKNDGSKVHPVQCVGCNFTKAQMAKYGMHTNDKLPRKTTMYWCQECSAPLCIAPCFEIFHTEADYRKALLEYRLKKLDK